MDKINLTNTKDFTWTTLDYISVSIPSSLENLVAIESPTDDTIHLSDVLQATQDATVNKQKKTTKGKSPPATFKFSNKVWMQCQEPAAKGKTAGVSFLGGVHHCGTPGEE